MSEKIAGTRKVLRTENNNAKKKGECEVCGGRKKYLEKRAYEPKMIINHLGHVDRELEWILGEPMQVRYFFWVVFFFIDE